MATFETPKPNQAEQEITPDSPDDFSTPPQSLTRKPGRPKGSKNLKRMEINYDPEAIGQRTRSKMYKGNLDEEGDYLMPVLNTASIKSSQTGHTSNGSEPSSGILDSGLLRYKWEYQGSSKSHTNPNDSETSNGKD